MSLPIYSNLIIKADPSNLAQVQAQLRRTFSDNNLTLDVLSPAKLSQINNVLAETRRQSTGLVRDFQDIGKQVDNVFRRFSAYLIASGGILTTIALFKSAVGEALKFQNELIRIKQVSGDADSVIKELGRTVSDLAKNYGVSSTELAKSATVLKQAGLTTKDVSIALKALAKTDLAPNFDNIAKTTEGLIAIFQQFGKNIDNVEGQLGSLNAVAGAFAVEASDLITLVQKAGGAAASSGASFEQLLAVFTSVRATTRESADAISTGLRTIFGRLQRPDTIKFLDELGIKMRFTAEEAEKLGKADLAGKFVGPFEAIMRIAKGTSGLGEGSTLFSNIVEEIGGLRQLSRVVPLLRETATSIEALNVAQAGKASLDIQAAIKTESYINQLNKIKETFLAIGRTLVESEGFNRFIQFLDVAARGAIKLLDALGPLLPYLGIIVGGNIAAGALGGIGKRFYGAFGGNPNIPPPKKGYASGGIIPGPSNGDNYPAMLEGGEAVIPAKSVRRYPTFIKSLISGQLPGFSSGGIAGDPGWSGKRMSSIDVERALIEVAKRTGVNPEEIIKRVKIIKGLESQTHPGFEAAGSMSKSGVMKLNPNQIMDYEHLVNLVAHETGHGRSNKLGLLNDPEHKKFLSSPGAIAEAEAFAKATRQSFAPTGRYGIPYAMTASEMTANLFASGNQGAIRATEEEKARAAAYIARKEAEMALPPAAPRQPNMLDRFANKVNSGLNSAVYGSFDAIKGMFGGSVSSDPINNQALAGKLSTNDLSGNLARTSSSSKKGERYFNALAIRSLDQDSANAQLQAILKAKEQEKALKDEIDSLREGRREGRQYYPKRLRGDTSKYDFSQVGENAQAYLRDKGGYIGNIRAKEAELAQLRQNLNNPNFGIRSGSLTGPTGLGSIGMAGVNNNGFGGGFGGYGPPSPNNPYFQGQGINYAGNTQPYFGQSRYQTGTTFGGAGAGGIAGTTGSPGTVGTVGPGGIATESIISKLNRNRGLNALSSIAGIVTPLGLGYAASKSDNTADQNKLGAASIGSSIGGTLGSGFGPIGTVIGAGIGALAGWFAGAAVAAKEIEQTTIKNKLDKSIQGLNETLENIANGSGSISELTKNLEDVRRQSIAKAILDTKSGGDFIGASSGEFKKSAGLQLPSIQKVLGEEIKKQAKSGQGFSTEGDVGKLISTIATIRGTSSDKIKEENKRLFDAARLDEVNRQAASRFTLEINKSVASATAFAEAVGKAAEETRVLDEKLKVLTGGGYVGASFGVGEFGNVNRGVLGNLNSINGLSGLTGQVGSVEQIAKFLPDVLSRVVKPGQQTSDNLAGDFTSVFKNIGEQTGIQFDKRVISVLADKLQSLKSDDLFEDFKKAPEKFAKEFISSYEPALKALQNIGKNLEERDKAYQDGLRHLLQMNDRLNSLSEQSSSQSSQYSQIIGGFKLSNAGIDPSRIANVGAVFGSFNKEQNRLLGQEGIGGNASAIGDLLQQRKAEADALRQKAKEEADSGKASTVFRDALFEAEKKLANVTRALERLTNTSERLSVLQQAITAEENIKAGKLDLTRKIATASPQELLQLNFQAQGANLLVRNGAAAIRNRFGPLGLQQGLEALEGPFGNVKVPSRFSKGGIDLTGKEIAKKLLEELNLNAKGNLNVGAENKAIKAAQAGVENVLGQGGAATGVIADNLLKTAEDFKKILTDNNSEFFTKLDRYITELQNNALSSEKGLKQTRLNEIANDVSGAKELTQPAFLNSGVSPDDIRKNIKAIKAAKESTAEFESINKSAEGNATAAEGFIRGNLGKLSPKEISDRLSDFGFNEDQRRSVLKSLENVKDSDIRKQLGTVLDKGVLRPGKKQEDADRILSNETLQSLPPEIKQRLIEIQTEGARNKALSDRSKVQDKRFLNLSPEAIKLAESGKNVEGILAENEKLKNEIITIQNRIKVGGGDFVGPLPQINEGPDPRSNLLNRRTDLKEFVTPEGLNPVGRFPKPSPRPLPEVSPVSSFERANEIFTGFNTNFAKQVEALAAIPRVIDMNVNQKVEIIINGAEILNNLEPGMKAIANGAVARAIEVIGGQLRENNISINYNPNDTNEQANPQARGRVA